MTEYCHRASCRHTRSAHRDGQECRLDCHCSFFLEAVAVPVHQAAWALKRRGEVEPTLSVHLPLVLPSAANARESHFARHRRVKAQRRAVALSLLGAGVRPRVQAIAAAMKPGHVAVVRMTRCAPEELDDDNLASSLKAVRDEVAKALKVNDRDKHRVRFFPYWRPTSTSGLHLEIRVESVEPSASKHHSQRRAEFERAALLLDVAERCQPR